MNYPTPDNPIVLTFKGHTPALKNRRFVVDGIPMTSKAVRSWMKVASDEAQYQWQKQQNRYGFGPILLPHIVRCITYVHFYAAKASSIPTSDMDNACSTIQELLQLADKPGGELGVIEDDKQIFSNAQRKRITRNKKTEHAVILLWVDDGRPESDQERQVESNFESIVQRVFDFGSSLPELLIDS